jgi:transitional endoplasmic reticulum ATPase
MGPEDLEKLQVAIGDLVEVAGKRHTVCKAMPAYKELRGRSRMHWTASAGKTPAPA